MKQGLSGIMPAIASPCDEGDVFLEDRFAALAVSLYQEGVHGLYVCGATGDNHKMRLEERKRAAEIAVGLAGEFHGKTIVHVGANSSRDAMELGEHAAETGASAVASMPLVNCTQAQLVSYYSDIARAAGVPVLVYYIPALTNRVFTVQEMLELLDIDGVVGFKFSDYNLLFLRQVLNARSDIIVFNGEDQILCPALLYGAHGGIGMFYNVFPRAFLELYRAAIEQNIVRAMDLQNRIISFLEVAFRYGIRQTLDFILKERGFGSYIYRRPRFSLDGAASSRLGEELKPLMESIDAACERIPADEESTRDIAVATRGGTARGDL